jgi:predicted metal-dependent hydrolase
MDDQHYKIRNSRGEQVMVIFRRDKRLKKTLRWEHTSDGTILLRVPVRIPKHRVGDILKQVAVQLDKGIALHTRRNDEMLQSRAEQINCKYLQNKIQWNAIRWVSNMQTRLGSCTRGGPTDGEIRISDKIRDWPDWVVDYVIAHELMHRKHPNHSRAFWDELKAAYPQTDRARGFIEGMGFARGREFGDDPSQD